MQMMALFDVVILGYGLYIVYGAVRMKRTRQLSSWLMGSRPAASMRDVQGYIDYIFGRIVLMGGIAAVFGAVGLYNDLVTPLPWVMRALVLLFLVVCVWFYVSMNRAKRRFW